MSDEKDVCGLYLEVVMASKDKPQIIFAPFLKLKVDKRHGMIISTFVDIFLNDTQGKRRAKESLKNGD